MHEWIKNLNESDKKTMKNLIGEIENKIYKLNVEENDICFVIGLLLLKKIENLEKRITKIEKNMLKNRKVPDISEDLKKY